MDLIIGGSYQGKLDYAKKKLKRKGIILRSGQIAEAEKIDEVHFGEILILNHLHLFVKQMTYNNRENEILQIIKQIVVTNPNCILICDEVGYGIIPLEEKERRYREHVGRLLCELVKLADSVERIVGGLPMQLK